MPALNFWKITKGLNFNPTTTPSSPSNGDFYYNISTNLFQFYQNGTWESIISGPGSSTDTAIAVWNGTNGSFLNNTAVTIDGSNNINGIAALTTNAPSAISGTIASSAQLRVGGVGSVSGTTQSGIFQDWQSSNATTLYLNQVGSNAGYSGSGTLGAAVGFKVSGFTNSGSGTITRTIAFDATPSTTGTGGNAILSDNSAFAGNYFINQSGTTDSVFGGHINAPAFITTSSNPATAGTVRLANADAIEFRNVANGANIALAPGSSDTFISYGGIDLANISSSQTFTNKTLTSPVISGGSATNLTSLLVGTSSALSSEIFTVHNTVTTNAATISNFIQTTNNVDAAYTQGGSATELVRAIRQITNSQTDTGTYRAGYFQNRFVIPTSMTLTNTAGRNTTIFIDAPNISGGGTSAITNYHGLWIAASSQATGTRKSGITINAQSGATNNAAIADSESFTGNWWLNQSSSTNPSIVNGSFIIGTAALSTSATDGFLYLPTCAGAPSGTPSTQTGTAATVYDTSNNKLYIYNGAWKSVTLT